MENFEYRNLLFWNSLSKTYGYKLYKPKPARERILKMKIPRKTDFISKKDRERPTFFWVKLREGPILWIKLREGPIFQEKNFERRIS